MRLCTILALLLVPAMAPAAKLGRAVPKNSWLLKQDRRMHGALPAKPVSRSRSVRRFTNWTKAQREKKSGLPPNTHLTARPAAGRLPSPATAKRQYGLKRQPTAVETVRIPRGQPVRAGRVWAEKRKRWEWTSPKPIAPKNVMSIRRIKTPRRKQ